MNRAINILAAPFLLALIVLATSWSLLHPQLFRAHDYIHAARVAEMARGIVEGQAPVRWSGNFGYGYGMPLFEFYSPLPYYLGALLWLIAIPIDIVVKLLFFIPSLITVIAAYKLGKVWFPTLTAVLVAAAIALAPYRAVNLFVRGAVAEAWGMAFLVVSLLGVSYVVKRSKYGSWVLLGGLVGMVLSHNLTTMIAVPALVIWGVVSLVAEALPIEKSSFWKNLWQTFVKILPSLLGVGSISIGLTTFYWLPALTENHFTQLDSRILTGYFDFHNHFLYLRQFFIPFWGYGGSNWGPIDGLSFFLGFGMLLGFALTTVTLCAYFVRSFIIMRYKTDRMLLSVFLGAGAIMLYAAILSLQRSLPIWELVPVLHVLQFPWRFLSILTTIGGVFSVLWIGVLPKRRYLRITVALLYFALLLSNLRYFQPEQYLENSADLYYTDSSLIQNSMSETLPDYIPTAMNLTSPPTTLASCVPATCQVSTVLQNTSVQKLVEVTADQATQLTVSTAFYPGWKITIDDVAQEIVVSDTGLISVPLAQGTHSVRWYFDSTPTRKIADRISLLSLGIVAIVLANEFSKARLKKKVNGLRTETPYLPFD
ncbi:hypothetical protein KA012_00205 [Candidatus Woesebacteria bacterium]|nr:hypothetical protein [Candidatus Woesebacteria bacterium]